MVSEQPTREVTKLLRASGWVPGRRVGSHTKWTGPNGSGFALPRRTPRDQPRRLSHPAQSDEGGRDQVRTYDARVTRDGKWWMIAIPGIDGLTQARRLSEAEQMAREYVALVLDVPFESVAIRLAIDEVGGIDVSGALADISAGRERAAAMEAESRQRVEQFAKVLADANVPVRDIGTIMGVSFQRAHQLVTAQH